MLLRASKQSLHHLHPIVASSFSNPRLLHRLTRHLHVAPLLLPTSSFPLSRAHSTCSQLRMAVAEPPVNGQAARVQQPPWSIPTKSEPEPELVVENSLTRTKTPFVPMKGKHVTWYNCGPTVYDASHMGHARNYVSQDILRRILRHLGYSIHFVMNITDIDDKIITRARQNHLLDEFRSQYPHLTEALAKQVREAWDAFLEEKIILSKKLNKESNGTLNENWTESEEHILPLPPPAGENEGYWEALSRLNQDPVQQARLTAKDPKFPMYFAALDRSRQAIIAAASYVLAPERPSSKDLIDASVDILAESLDKALRHRVTDREIFRALAAKWETSYFQDMKRLNVMPPSQLTRVSEYVPEIVAYIEKIIDNGFAYADANGNVWFDTKRFDGGKTSDGDKFSYAKLAPWSKGNRELQEEGEGSLSTSATATQGKRSASDFALWKSSKSGEPSWESPWSEGRPGWHIECSVMASEVLGTRIDIHSGGVDLMFPHHDNELAQAEAHNGCSPWINYFLHTGHLHIKGKKMSKSLKNFITIDEALNRRSARQLRLSFLMSRWSGTMDIEEDLAMPEVEQAEKDFANFFTTVKAHLRKASNRGDGWSDGQHHYGDDEKNLIAAMTQAQLEFHQALCDSVDTPKAIKVLQNLVSAANKYEKVQREQGRNVNAGVLENVGKWVGDMLRMFGLGEGPVREGDIGWGEKEEEGAGSELDREAIVLPFANAVSKFRDSVRQEAIREQARKKAGEEARPAEFLKLADKLRDEDLVDLGVALEDGKDGTAMVKLVPAERLRAERDERIKNAEDNLRKKEAARRAEAEARRERLATLPEMLFRPRTQGGLAEEGQWSEWNEAGIPITDGEGKPVSKGQQKSLEKQQTKHKNVLEEARKKGEIE